jgi:DNA polymerase-3 subunit chi
MIEVSFYHLTSRTVDSALQALLERVQGRGWRAVVQASSSARLKQIDEHLWSYRRESFLPHGGAADPDPVSQPIYLTCKNDDNPNAAEIRFFVEGVALAPVLESDAAPTTRAALIFDGEDSTELQDARAQWRELRDAGYMLVYYQQNDDGKWVEKAREPKP